MSTWKPSTSTTPRKRTFEEVLDLVQGAIHAGELRPGDRLPAERDLASALGVSRASVREATRVLEALGLVRVKVGSGPVQGVTIRESPGDELERIFGMWMGLKHVGVQDLVEFRAVVESWSASTIAARRHDDPDTGEALTGLGEIVQRMAATETKEDYLELDTEFHILIVQASGNRLAGLVSRAVRGSMRTNMLQAFGKIDSWNDERARLTKEHARILELLTRGSMDEVKAAAVNHVRRFYSTYLADELEVYPTA